MGLSRQEYWSGLPFPPPGDLPNPGIEPRSPALQADSLPTELQGCQSSNEELVLQCRPPVWQQRSIGWLGSGGLGFWRDWSLFISIYLNAFFLDLREQWAFLLCLLNSLRPRNWSCALRCSDKMFSLHAVMLVTGVDASFPWFSALSSDSQLCPLQFI